MFHSNIRSWQLEQLKRWPWKKQGLLKVFIPLDIVIGDELLFFIVFGKMARL